jgi:hypothetical protein
MGRHSPAFETWNRICKLYGWPQIFVVVTTHDLDPDADLRAPDLLWLIPNMLGSST